MLPRSAVLVFLILAANAGAQCPDGTPPPCKGVIQPGAARGPAAPTLDARTVAVLPFDVLTPDTATTQAARIAADWLMQGIAQLDSINVVSSTLVNAAVGEKSGDLLTRVARMTHAGTLITGSASRLGDSVRLQASIVNASTGRVIRAIDPVMGPMANPISAINALRDRTLGSIAVGDAERRVAVAGQPPNYSAYREYMVAVEQYTLNPGSRPARESFRRAIALDSSFMLPYLYLVVSYIDAGENDTSAALIATVDARHSTLSPTDQLQLTYARARLNGDLDGELRAAIASQARSSGDPYQVGRAALSLLKVSIAIPALEASDSIPAPVKYQPTLTRLVEAYHVAGKHAREAATIELARQRYPTNAVWLDRRLRALAGLHQGPAAMALADTIWKGGGNPVNALNAMTVAASEFDAHGDSVTSRKLLTSGLAAFAAARSPTSIRSERAMGVAWLDLGQLDSARVHLERALPDTSGNAIETVAELAIISARRGDNARARSVADSLVANPRAWDRGLSLYSSAGILAMLGDREAAMRLLLQAHAKGQWMTTWHYAPSLKPLRGYAPFEALIKAR